MCVVCLPVDVEVRRALEVFTYEYCDFGIVEGDLNSRWLQ